MDETVARHESERVIRNLTRELFQTENSAAVHCHREAERQPGDTGPRRALEAVAQHAREVLSELPGLARRNSLPVSRAGSLIGRLFSQSRDKALDLVISAERSYRGTLLGCRHGLDVVRMLEAFARETGRAELADFCTRWLARREPLIQHVQEQLRWFAGHPGDAHAPARTLRGQASKRSNGHPVAP